MKKITSTLLRIFGGLFPILTIVSAFAALTSLAERSKYGSGLFFADEEIFIALALIFLTLAILCFCIAAKIRKNSTAKS